MLQTLVLSPTRELAEQNGAVMGLPRGEVLVLGDPGEGCVGIAVDTLSLDFGKSPDFAVHYAWLPQGRWGLECVAGLDALPAAGATMIVGAPKHRGGSGGPTRVFALS